MNDHDFSEHQADDGCSTTGSSTDDQQTVALTDWLTAADESEGGGALSVLRLSNEPAYASLFTDNGVPATAHYLERTESWVGGYVHCLGDDCPACLAQIDRKRFLLIPAVDLTDACVKVIRVPAEKGPGKLVTELVKILCLENRAEIVTKITRSRNFTYQVDPHRQDTLNPDVAAAIKRFLERLEDGAIDIASVIARVPAEEIAAHERVAKRLMLESGSA